MHVLKETLLNREGSVLVYVVSSFLFVVFGNDIPDTLRRDEKIADGAVMVQRVDDVSEKLTHVTAVMPGPVKQLLRLIIQVGGINPVENTVFESFVEFVETVGEKTESREEEDALCAALLKSLCDLEGTVAGCDHIVDDDHVLAFYAGTEEFKGYDGVCAFHDTCTGRWQNTQRASCRLHRG